MKKTGKKKNTLKTILIIILIFWGISKCNKFIENHNYTKPTYQDNALNIIASSENEILDDDIKKIAKKLKTKITIQYADTLDIIDRLNLGEKFDAVWISNSIWLYQVDSKIANIKYSKSLSINPVIFGIKKSKAEELGFTNKDVYTKDIVKAIKDGKLKFSISNPTSTNSGASAYLGILQTLAGNPEVLTEKHLENETLKTNIKDFFNGVERTSGSEDFLEQLFLEGNYEAVVAYETSIININKKLVKENKEPLYAIYPIDGVSISDSVFAYIDNKDDNKKEMFEKIQDYLLGTEGQKLLSSYGRRTWYGGVNENASKDIFNPDWGINTTKYITPIKYPSTSVINKALALYQIELRKPIHVVFCLDYSGSMYGDGIDELKDAMNYILNEETASKNYIQFSEKDKIDIVTFSTNVEDIWSTTNGSLTEDLLNNINGKEPYGATALYPAAIKALDLLKDEDNSYNLSIILMTDGEANVGTFKELKNAYKEINRDIPIYSIAFGDASEWELDEISELTNAKTFNGKYDLVTAFKKVRGYN